MVHSIVTCNWNVQIVMEMNCSPFYNKTMCILLQCLLASMARSVRRHLWKCSRKQITMSVWWKHSKLFHIQIADSLHPQLVDGHKPSVHTKNGRTNFVDRIDLKSAETIWLLSWPLVSMGYYRFTSSLRGIFSYYFMSQRRVGSKRSGVLGDEIY